MKTAKKSNPQQFFSPKSRKWRKKSIARQHLHVPRSCRRRLAILQQLSLKQDDLEWPPLLPGCGTQHPLRALGGTRVLLAAAPTTPPCFRHWRRSSSLQRKNYFNFGVLKRLRLRSLFRTPFSRVGQCSKAVRHSSDGLAALIGKDRSGDGNCYFARPSFFSRFHARMTCTLVTRLPGVKEPSPMSGSSPASTAQRAALAVSGSATSL